MPSNQSETMDSVRFAESVDPDSSVTLSYELPQDATIEEVTVRIYRGAELDLHVTPWHNPAGGRDVQEPLITFEGKEYIDGDGDHWEFPLSDGVKEGDTIGVTIDNVSSGSDGYTLDAAADFVVDRAGGSDRGLLSLLRRWF